MGNLVLVGCLEVERVGKHLEPTLRCKYWNPCTKSFVLIPWPADEALTHFEVIELRWLSWQVVNVQFGVKLDPDRLREHQGMLGYFAERRHAWVAEQIAAKRMTPAGEPAPASPAKAKPGKRPRGKMEPWVRLSADEMRARGKRKVG